MSIETLYRNGEIRGPLVTGLDHRMEQIWPCIEICFLIFPLPLMRKFNCMYVDHGALNVNVKSSKPGQIWTHSKNVLIE